MNFFKHAFRRKSNSNHSTPAGSRRHSRDLTPITLVQAGFVEKRPSVTMIPRDSAASLPCSPQPPPQRPSQHRAKPPSLADILADRAQPPWTLSAFAAYCEQNMCLENLLFLQDAQKYHRRYQDWVNNGGDARAEKTIKLWKRMLADYIRPGGQREVNLTGSVRELVLAYPDGDLPANPQLLVPAVKLTQRLIEDSILFSFLHDVEPEEPAIPAMPMPMPAAARSRGGTADHAYLSSSVPPRLSGPARSIYGDYAASSATASLDAAVDDSAASASLASPSAASSRTPPMSPPLSEYGSVSGSAISSSLSHSLSARGGGGDPRPRSDSSWRRLGAKLGLAKGSQVQSQAHSHSPHSPHSHASAGATSTSTSKRSTSRLRAQSSDAGVLH